MPTGTQEAAIQVERIAFGYTPGAELFHDLSLTFKRGRITALLGPSGCGKSTLLRLLCGLYTPTRGRLLFDGNPLDTRDRHQLALIRRNLGVLFQFGALFKDLSVHDNVAYPLREHTRLPEWAIHDLVLMKLEAVGLRGTAELAIEHLSGGMARRVALARAIALDPALLFYDEPFTGLDPVSTAVIVRLIRDIGHATRATSLLVTHDVQQAFQICDHAYLMGPGGRILASGSPAELQAHPDPQVQQFINGQADGPFRFHHPAPSLPAAFGMLP
ncbi:ABC transporter ATP-binding protein [Pseudomonas oryzihabitans]|uniref:ABC transporter ATP-binding protein n=1 Tax=Pseudomonas oryzihabitans TaxID=47885 RepID=UPI00135DC725|nr:ATP-binding cassette domain-containing protein [Pseudomonas oryzihabitans]MXS21557.1 ATP-binding cassette domain-containing protein [Pseudomonas oryzihabitans]